MTESTVYLIGAGPGDPGLITMRAAELIQRAQAVVYDRLIGRGVLEMIPCTAEKIDVGKNAGNHPVPQEEIGGILLSLAKKYKTVVRLKGGDPFVFGRGGEEAEVLRSGGVAFEIVPGVTSAIAAAAYAGIPVTHREYSSALHILTGHGKEDSAVNIDYDALCKLGGTLVFMMSVSTAEAIAGGLIGAGMSGDTPAAIIENGTTAAQRSFTFKISELTAVIDREMVKSPAVIIVGGVCGAGRKLAWFTEKPLFGCRILVTRPRKIASGFGSILSELGADVTYYPCVKTVALEFTPCLDGVRCAVFTSAAGVTAFFAGLMKSGLDSRALHGIFIAAVGPKTAAELLVHGISADFVPSSYNGADLARELVSGGHIRPGETAVLFRAREGSAELSDILRLSGVTADDIPVYETLPDTDTAINISEFDFLTFTSASCVKNFVAANAGADYTRLTAICIGELTAQAARDAGMSAIISDSADIESMANKLLEVWHGYKTQTSEEK